MKTKHTPKDWYIEPGDYNSLFVSTTDNGSVVICHVFSNDVFDNPMPQEMVRANARLIAAAPALLEACEAITNCSYTQMGPILDAETKEPYRLVSVSPQLFRKLLAAISLAKEENDGSQE